MLGTTQVAGVVEHQVGKGTGWLKKNVTRRLIEREGRRGVFHATLRAYRLLALIWEGEAGRGEKGKGLYLGF